MIGDRDSLGNTLRLGGKNVSIWERPDSSFLLSFTDKKETFYVKSEKEAIEWYNKVEGSNHFALPVLPPLRTISQKKKKKDEEEEPLILPEGAHLLGKFESLSRPGKFYTVVRYSKGETRCTCWPFIRNSDCNHYQLIKSVLLKLPVEKLIEKPITVRYNRKEA
jgi:hypothetical protein